MKKRIFIVLSLFSAVFMLTAAFSVGAVYYRFYRETARGEIRSECAMLAKTLDSQASNPDFLNYFQSGAHPDTRITLIAEDGTVLFDTSGSPETLQNHSDRSEVADAQKNGTGEITRYSETLKSDSFYYCVRLNNNDVLRLSRQIDTISGVFKSTLPVVLLLVVLLIALSLLLSSRLSRFLLRPVNSAAEELNQMLLSPADAPQEDDIESPYEELSPFLQKIRALRGELFLYIKTLREEKDTFDTMTKNLHEGLILLSGDKNVLTINHSAMAMLSLPDNVDYSGQNLLHLTRSLALHRALDEVISTGIGKTLDERDERLGVRRFFLSPASGVAERSAGAMIFIADVTAETKAEEMRRDFAANVSHELKTPLTSIRGFAELIENGMTKSESDTHAFAARIHGEANRLLSLIEDIIRLSEIETGPSPKLERCRLSDIAEECVSSLSETAAARDISLVAECGDIDLPGNRAMLCELVYNLLDNAVKYNRPGGSATVSVKHIGNSAVIAVSDTGIGIPSEQFTRIFERFYRVDKSRSKQTGGTGLGLSIVKHIVEAHGGRTDIKSEIGVGTTITVYLPISVG